jgi:hypothetical protein
MRPCVSLYDPTDTEDRRGSPFVHAVGPGLWIPNCCPNHTYVYCGVVGEVGLSVGKLSLGCCSTIMSTNAHPMTMTIRLLRCIYGNRPYTHNSS